MIIDTRKFSGRCACGQAHSMATKYAVIEPGCLKTMHDQLAQEGLRGPCAAIYDTNTYEAVGQGRPAASQEIIVGAQGLRANEASVAEILRKLAPGTAYLIAIGGGTLHDIVRACASKLRIPFVSCPTAASTDSYSAGNCERPWAGTLSQSAAPAYVFADLNVIRNAPKALTRAGVGEALSKHTALADWKIACLFGNETLCPQAETLLRQAAVAAEGACAGLAAEEESAYAQLMYALLLSGFAVQLLGDGQPAFGSEHMLSTLMREMPQTFGPLVPSLQGELSGVCAVAIAGLYHRLLDIDDIAPYLPQEADPDIDLLTQEFGASQTMKLLKDNTPDCMRSITKADIADNWREICHIIAEIPTPDALAAMLASVGGKATMKELGISTAKLPRMLQLAPYLRNQLTLTRLLRRLRFRYASKADASRAPSRKSRYADKAIMRAGNSNAVSASSMR